MTLKEIGSNKAKKQKEAKTEEGEEKLHLLMLDNHIPAGAKMY